MKSKHNHGGLESTVFRLLAVICLLESGRPLFAQSPAIQPVPPTPGIAAPRDVEYPGVMRIRVDATDLERHIFDVSQTIPVQKAGRMTLLYPEWIPGTHSPHDNTVHLMAGLTITANGRSVPWQRDEIEMTAIHVAVPEGARALELHFQFLSPTDGKIGRIVVTPLMLNLQWWSTAFYPAGHYVSRIQVEPSVKLPPGWGFGCALETNSISEGWIRFKPVTFEMLVDSPMFAGRYFRQVNLTDTSEVPVRMNVVADSDELLEIGPKSMEAHRELIVQARRLFGSQHYSHYDFLVAATETLGMIGLEHHQSSENGVLKNYFTEWDKALLRRSLLPHELVHSWNGKFRRPSDLWTPNYQGPMRDSLLWVYEGLTTYWGDVLTARSGMLSTQQSLEFLAMKLAGQNAARGRLWRSLQDTTQDPIIARRRPIPWRSYQRSEDYYPDGSLLWLDADTLIREKTSGKKSLDDFGRLFFGIQDGTLGPVTYEFDDVVKAMNEIAPHDWRQFFKSHLESPTQSAPLDGITRGGYRLIFTNSPTECFKAEETGRKVNDFSHSLGFKVEKEDALSEVIWDSPAFKAGLTVGVKLVAVNSEAYDTDKLKSAIKRAAQPNAEAIELLVKDGNHYRTVKLDYHDGLRYPLLERIPDAPALLNDILAPRK